MTGPGSRPVWPEDPVARRQAFRDFVRAHHPDVGGDPATFQAGIRSYREVGTGPGPGRPVRADVVFRRSRWWDAGGTTSWLGRRVRRLVRRRVV